MNEREQGIRDKEDTKIKKRRSNKKQAFKEVVLSCIKWNKKHNLFTHTVAKETAKEKVKN